MARVSAIDPAAADPSLKPLFDDFLRERGAVPNMFRTLAHDPEVLKTWFAMFRATLEAQIACLLDEGPAAEFTEAERAAVDFAEELTKYPQGVRDEAWTALRKHWDERQAVELVAVAAMFNSFNRFNNALGVDLTVYPKKLG
jgi:alkylhydroperoxidase family enzyme